jgi:lysozyme
MPYLNGADVSAFQGEIDFALAKPHLDFLYAKAAEGVTYTDDHFRQYHDGAKAHGIPFGAYFFFQFRDNPQKQAEFFCRTIDGYQGTLLPMVDIEAGGNDPRLAKSQRTQYLSAFILAVERLMAVPYVIIYANPSDWLSMIGDTGAFRGHPSWVAAYNNDPDPPKLSGWRDWTLWQHTDKGEIPGIQGHVDLDILNGPISVIERR